MAGENAFEALALPSMLIFLLFIDITLVCFEQKAFHNGCNDSYVNINLSFISLDKNQFSVGMSGVFI